MKNILVLFNFLWFTVNLQAKCGGEGISFYPNNGKLEANSIIILDIYSVHAELENYNFSAQQKAEFLPVAYIAKRLGKEFPMFLVSKNEKIGVEIVEILRGGFFVNQYILKPKKGLKIGERYSLFIQNLPKSCAFTEPWHLKDENFKSWTIQPSVDNRMGKSPFNWAFEKHEYAFYGCGPSEYLNLKNSNFNGLVLATLRLKGATKTTQFYLIPNKEGVIAVGHGMCSGAFSFSEKTADYELTFQAVSWSGQKLKQTATINFTRSFVEKNRENHPIVNLK
jgi:hypothetical protein